MSTHFAYFSRFLRSRVARREDSKAGFMVVQDTLEQLVRHHNDIVDRVNNHELRLSLLEPPGPPPSGP